MAHPKQSRAPSLFISHGAGPFPLIGPEWEHYRQQVAKLGTKLDDIKAIILISAHWETDEPHITALDNPGLYFDYGTVPNAKDFVPQAAYETKYPVVGDAKLAADIAGRLHEFGFNPVLDHERGLDHGVFVPLKIMRPEADIPVVELSVLTGKDEKDATDKNLKLGRALEIFRDAGYAILGSGGSYHDFTTGIKATLTGSAIPSSAEDFEDYLRDTASIPNVDDRVKVLGRWREHPASYVSHVRGEAEHFWPFLVAAGSGGNAAGVRQELIRSRGGPMSFYEW